MQLLQEKLAEKIWLENQYGGDLTQKKLEAMMIDCNLKYRKEKSYNDLVVAIGNGYKNSFGKSKVVREQSTLHITKEPPMDDGKIYYETGETKCGYAEGSIGALNGMDRVMAELPDTY